MVFGAPMTLSMFLSDLVNDCTSCCRQTLRNMNETLRGHIG